MVTHRGGNMTPQFLTSEQVWMLWSTEVHIYLAPSGNWTPVVEPVARCCSD
jgi:hypothetical protein